MIGTGVVELESAFRAETAAEDYAVDLFVSPDLMTLDEQLDAVYAEVQEFPASDEKYGHSLNTLRRWGEFMLQDSVEVSAEIKGLETVAYDDFKTKVVEMLKTDVDFRERLDVETSNTFELVDGKAVWADGTPFSEMLSRGLDSARAAADEDPRLEAEAERAEGDLEVNLIVDNLKPGEAYVALSLDPKRELEKHTKLYESKGYRKGIAYAQWYCKHDENTLEAGSFSVDLSDEKRWREVGGKHGLNIPAGESPNRFIRHGRKLQATPDQTRELVREMRDDYYQASGSDKKRFSITEYIEANEPLIKNIFLSYYTKIAQSVFLGENNRSLQDFAAEIVKNPPRNMKAELVTELHDIAHLNEFSSSFGRTLDDALCYAAVESLRGGIGKLVHGANLATIAKETHRQQQAYSQLPTQAYMAQMNQTLAGNIHSGVSAGRSYGGCGAAVAMSESMRDGDSSSDDRNRQGIFGGRGEKPENSDNNESKKWEYKIGFCIVPNCPRGEKPAKVGPCNVCKQCENLDNSGANLLTYYRQTSKQRDTEQRRIDELFVSIVNVEVEPTGTELTQNEIEITPHEEMVFDELKINEQDKPDDE